MPEQLKHIYSRAFFTPLLQVLEEIVPGLDEQRFLRQIFDPDWDSRELKQRMRHIAAVLRSYLPAPWPAAAEALKQISARLLESGVREGSFQYMFLPDVIEQFGLDDFEVSAEAMEQVTCLASAEFCVRPFLLRDQEWMLDRMTGWCTHPHPQVRRLASEGTRPRLPWGMGIPSLKKDPSPILPILETLRRDSSEMVRRSVANNLNDIAKDHPDLVVEIARRWMGDGCPEVRRVVRHGCRTLLRKAHPEALLLFGFRHDSSVTGRVTVDPPALDSSMVPIGGNLGFSFRLRVGGSESVRLRLEYAIDYVKAGGGRSRKVFRVTENVFAPDAPEPFEFRRHQSFRQMTTRRHYPGEHRLAILVNGQEAAAVPFVVTD